MSNSANPQIPWWKRGQRETLDDRVRAVQNVNDASIISDDVQRWSKVALVFLLAFTTLLSGFSYFKFFEKSFGFHLAVVMALLLACVIEFGKNWGFLKVLRIPFFQGWNFVWAEISNTVMWVFLLLLSVVTFAASVYNSTQGAHQLSLLLSHERSYSAFTPNTGDIDAQIAALTKSDEDLGSIKRKNGKTNWAIQPMKAENAKTLASLQEQRRVLIEKQRTDWEKQDAIKEGQNQFGANSLLAVGGWVELLQIILMFVRVSAERSLDKTASQRRNATSPPPFSKNGKHHTQQQPFENHGRFTFFNRDESGNVRSAYESEQQQPIETTVTQSPQTVTQTNYANDVLKLAMKELQGFAANFDGIHRNNKTVAENIYRILDETLAKMRQEGFCPSWEMYLKFHAYIDGTLFPLINVKGWGYESQAMFMHWLSHCRPSQQII